MDTRYEGMAADDIWAEVREKIRLLIRLAQSELRATESCEHASDDSTRIWEGVEGLLCDVQVGIDSMMSAKTSHLDNRPFFNRTWTDDEIVRGLDFLERATTRLSAHANGTTESERSHRLSSPRVIDIEAARRARRDQGDPKPLHNEYAAGPTSTSDSGAESWEGEAFGRQSGRQTREVESERRPNGENTGDYGAGART
jgi:hypothetical protein